MNSVALGFCVFMLVSGLLLTGDGLCRKPRSLSTATSTSLWTTVDNWWRRRRRAEKVRWIAGLTAGLLVFLVTGYPLALVGLPVLVVGVPALLAEPPNRDIDTLEAMDRWVRSLVASLPTGKSIPDAIRATAAQAPELLRHQVQVMVARLDARWTSREALMALADDLDCPEADAVVAALVLACQRGGVGAVATLGHLADATQVRLRALREVEAERAKPRVVVRQVTAISIIFISLAVLFQPSYFAPYRHPVGQVVCATIAVAYLLALVALRRMTIPRRRERILQRRVATQPDLVPEVHHA